MAEGPAVKLKASLLLTLGPGYQKANVTVMQYSGKVRDKIRDDRSGRTDFVHVADALTGI
jgi:hypothetical protein